MPFRILNNLYGLGLVSLVTRSSVFTNWINFVFGIIGHVLLAFVEVLSKFDVSLSNVLVFGAVDLFEILNFKEILVAKTAWFLSAIAKLVRLTG